MRPNLLVHEFGHMLATQMFMRAAGLHGLNSHVMLRPGGARSGVRVATKQFGNTMWLHPFIDRTVYAAGPAAALAFELPELADKLSPTELARVALAHHVTTSDTDKAGAEAGPWVEPVLDAVVRFTSDLYKHREGLPRLCSFVEDHGTLEISLGDLLKLSEGEPVELHSELPLDATANMTALIHAIKRHPDFFSDAIKKALTPISEKVHAPVLEEIA